MVSLRERTSRPSYSSLAGLENLSDGEGSPRNRAGTAAGGDSAEVDAGADNSDSEASLSSGASSEFRPGSEEGRGGTKGKGRASRGEGGDEGESDDDLFLAQESTDSDIEGAVEEDEEDEDIIPVQSSSKKIKKERRPTTTGTARPLITHPHSHQQARTPSHSQQPASRGPRQSYGKSEPTDTTHLPRAYRDLLKSSSEYLTKNPDARPQARNAGRDNEKYKKFGVEGFPAGPATPFTTRLRSTPMGSKVEHEGESKSEEEEEWTWDDTDVDRRRDARRERARLVEPHVPLHAPWQVWQGEGYWRGMWAGEDKSNVGEDASGASGEGQGVAKGKVRGKQKQKEQHSTVQIQPARPERKGWKLREEVSLGLEDVGRYDADDLVLLSQEQAAPYLPTTGPITCHIGPHAAQIPTTFNPFSSQSLHDTCSTDKNGFVFDAGGPIWGLDFCPTCSSSSSSSSSSSTSRTQYLAVSTLRHPNEEAILGQRVSSDTKGSVQIWSFAPQDASTANDGSPNDANGDMRCEIVLCLEGGGGLEVKWMPVGARDEDIADEDDPAFNKTKIPKLGILAVAQRDGIIGFYAIPHPRALRRLRPPGEGQTADEDGPFFLLLSDPLLWLEVADATVTCMDWMTGERLAVGLSNGHAAVWDVGDALREGQKDPLPAVYMPLALAAIRTIAVARSPPGNPEGEPDFEGDPCFIVFGSYDGMFVMVDVREPGHVIELTRQRTPTMAVAWSTQMASPIFADLENTIGLYKVFGSARYRSFALSAHRGPVWSLATSDYHTMLLSASSDGSAMVTNYQQGYNRKRKQPMLFHRLCEMDYDHHLKQWRMLDDFLPETMTLLLGADRATAKNQKTAEDDPSIITTGLWYPEIGVHKVTWHNTGGLRNAGWVAMGGASGLGRVEWIGGRFARGQVPRGF